MKKLIIQKQALTENIQKIVSHAAKGGAQVIAMLKGNGYGLGICEFARLLLQNGVHLLAVSEFCEAKQLRDGGIDAQIILLSPMCDLNEAQEAVRLGIICAVGSEESATVLELAASQQNRRVRAHICLDTGFGRFGFLPHDMAAVKRVLAQMKSVDIEGIFTHLSDSFGKPEHSRAQVARFTHAAAELEEAGYQFQLKHICNSCAFLRFPDLYLDAVRVGSAFLGRLPVQNTLGLKRNAYLESCICEKKTLPKGHNIGYANTYRTKRETTVAVIPVGYKDGFGVQKSNDAYRFMDILRYIYADVMALVRDNAVYVTINGKRCRLLGRISMFNIIADITDVAAEVGDAVRLDCNPILIDSAIAREYI